MSDVIANLEERGLLEAMTSDEIRGLVAEPTVVYAGFDPTSDSLQVGNLVAILALAHFQRCGHRPIALAGGATGMIGDPSGKEQERELLGRETVEANLEGIRENLSRFLDFEDANVPATIVNNHDWIGAFSYIAFLRDVGKHFRMGTMLGKESVRSRMDSDEGMSFAEFSYQTIQAYDFLHLHDSEGCRLQIGGSDQWGNITAGIDLIHKRRGQEAFGLTHPLVCDSNGQKFGKSEDGAIYLSAARTSIYDFYQYFLRTEDADAERYLKIFTFLDVSEIAEVGRASAEAPEKRLAQIRLAEEVTQIVHGPDGLRIAQRASAVLFGGEMQDMSSEDLLAIFSDVASTEFARDALVGTPIIEIVVTAGLCKSNSATRRLISSGGLYINNTRVGEIDTVVQADHLIDRRVMLLRSGKKNYHVVKVA